MFYVDFTIAVFGILLFVCIIVIVKTNKEL